MTKVGKARYGRWCEDELIVDLGGSVVGAVIIVEGKNDRERLLPHLAAHTQVVCTYGIPSHERLLAIVEEVQESDVIYIFTDNDQVGRRIRGMLSEEFPEAMHLHTKAEYGGVEKTPLEYLQQVLEKHELLANM